MTRIERVPCTIFIGHIDYAMAKTIYGILGGQKCWLSREKIIFDSYLNANPGAAQPRRQQQRRRQQFEDLSKNKRWWWRGVNSLRPYSAPHPYPPTPTLKSC